MKLLTPIGEHHKVVDEEGLLMMTTTIFPLQSLKRTPNRPPVEEQEVAAAPYRKT
jgi:hypothetical protein